MKKIKYGLYNIREERDEASEYVLRIHEDISEIRHNFIKLGFHLNEFKKCLYYEDMGFEDFYEFCEVNYQLDKSAVSRYINLWYQFCLINQPSGTRTMYIDKRYEDFSYSQLSEMLSLSDNERKNITPQMTIKDIRKYKKSLKGNFKVEKVVEDVATSQPKEVFSYEKYCNKIAINKAHYVRKCMLNNKVDLKIVDKNGREFSKRVNLVNDKNGYVFYLEEVLSNDEFRKK